MRDLTDPAALTAYLDAARFSLFRYEGLDSYAVASDGGDFGRYVAGEPGPDPERKAASHRRLRTRLDAGLTLAKVHAFTGPPSDYVRFEMEWGYAPNTHLEQIRILDLAEQPWPDGVPWPLADFWLVDGLDAAVMDYDGQNRYRGFRPVEDHTRAAPWIDAAAAIWAAAVPFGDYWNSHPQYRRDQAA